MAAEFNRVENPGEIEYQAFFDAVRRGGLHETKEFLTLHPNAITATDPWGTALHNAVLMGHEQIVEELVQLMTKEDLEVKDSYGMTALEYAARDNIKMVECMFTKNKKLLAVESGPSTPIVIAAFNEMEYSSVHLPFHTTRRSNAR